MTGFTRRDMALAAGGAALAGWAQTGAAAAALRAVTPFDPTPYVNPELRPLLPMVKKFAGGPLTDESVRAQRKNNVGYPLQPEPAWAERTIPGRPGSPDVRIFVVNAGRRTAARPAILYIHGGGYVLGTARQGVGDNQELAAALDCVVVSVEYRLAPETRFPGSLDDNYAALKWLYANAGQLGVDRTRIAVMGGSAGGGHAAMLAIAARDRGEVPIAYQALIYPMLDDRTGSTRRLPPHMGALIWDEQKNRFGWTALLGVPAGSRSVPSGSVPARVADLRGLPPTYIGVGSIDLFFDEDVEYARRLADAGIAVRLNAVPGAFHGFDVLGGQTGIGRAFKADLVASLRTALGIDAGAPAAPSRS